MTHNVHLPPKTFRVVQVKVDMLLLGAVFTLLIVGLLMVTSSSMGIAEKRLGQALYYFWRQFAYITTGLVMALIASMTPLVTWRRLANPLLLFSIFLLGLVLIPGIGRSVNGSMRWINIGPMAFQVSEVAKFAFVIFLSSYIVKHAQALRTQYFASIKPLMLLGGIALLLLLEPDFGAAVVLMATVMSMLFLAGVPLILFALLVMLCLASFGYLAFSASYRLERFIGFLDPWEHQFDTGYQLTQALIAFGQGEWFGVGLGAGVQKLFYLPEAHTDFLFAILAEELGLVGALSVLILFVIVVWRGFTIGFRAHQQNELFGAFVAYGFTLWIGMQALINVGVNTGVLPTKGLTLPLMSYGGSSLVVLITAIGLLMRVDFETRRLHVPRLKMKLDHA